jgi:hypothetical protein
MFFLNTALTRIRPCTKRPPVSRSFPVGLSTHAPEYRRTHCVVTLARRQRRANSTSMGWNPFRWFENYPQPCASYASYLLSLRVRCASANSTYAYRPVSNWYSNQYPLNGSNVSLNTISVIIIIVLEIITRVNGKLFGYTTLYRCQWRNQRGEGQSPGPDPPLEPCRILLK